MKKVSYVEEYVEILARVFGDKSIFLRSFGGEIKTFVEKEDFNEPLILNLNGPVIVGDIVENVGFEVSVEDQRFVSNVGVDEKPLDIKDMTISDLTYDMAMEELGYEAENWVRRYDYIVSKKLSDNASEKIRGELNEYGIEELFIEARDKFDGNRVSKNVEQVAYVTPEICNLLVRSGLATADGSATLNYDAGKIYTFKGFEIVRVRQSFFQAEENVYFVADGVGVSGLVVPHTEINRAKEFIGFVITSLGILGNHIPSKNKKAILKAVMK